MENLSQIPGPNLTKRQRHTHVNPQQSQPAEGSPEIDPIRVAWTKNWTEREVEIRFQHVDPLFERLNRGLQLLDSRLETGETIAHDVTPLLTGCESGCLPEPRSRPARESPAVAG